MDLYNHSTPISIKLPILDTGKFEQWKFRIQQYLQQEHYALWEVIEFGDSYKATPDETAKDKGPASKVSSSTKKKGGTMAITTEDMQKRKNDVKERTTLYWPSLMNIKTLEQTFKRLQAIVSHLEFMDVLVEQDDLNQKFLTSLAPKWLVYTIVWRNRDDLDTMSLDDVYNHLKVYKPEVQKRAGSNSQNMAFISSSNTSSGKNKVPTVQEASTASAQVHIVSNDVVAASLSYDTVCAFIATHSNGSQIKYEDISQIDDDDIEEINIKWNLALLSMRADRFWKKTGKKITIQGSNVAGFDKSKVECFNCHKMGHFARECRSPKSQDRGKRASYKKDFKVEELDSKAMVAIDEVPTEYALMAKSSSSSDNEVYDDSFCSKSCTKNTKNLNTKISKLNEELSNYETDLYNYKRGLSQVEARLVKFKENEIKYCEKIRVLERDIELKDNKIEYLRNELEEKDLSLMGLPEFVDDIVTDYTRPTPSIDVSKNVSKEQEERWKSNHPSFFEQGGSSSNVVQKPMIKFVKESGCPNATKVNNTENARKPTVKYAEIPNIPTVGLKVPTAKPAVVADKGNKGKAIKALARWIWKPKQTSFDQGLNFNGVSVTFKKYQYIDTQGRLKGYVSFVHERGKITGKGSIKTDFKLVDDKHVFLRTPRQQNMYTSDLKNVVPHKNLTCLIAKASVDESMLWHWRLGHLNFKTMNKLVRSNLVKGLPSKSFDNDHSCVACLKGKQHKASCKSKLVNSISKPLHTLRMDLFEPTSVSSLNPKWYCLVVTDDFFRSDNEGEFRNKEMDEFCFRKGIKREFCNARTPQHNGVVERRNKTFNEAAKTISPAIGFLRPFGCHVMILNTLDHLGKFDAKGDEGYFLGYSLSSKAFRVFNKGTKKIEENLHVDFLENKSIEKGIDPDWLFDIDTLTNSTNYVPVVVAGTSSTNISSTKEDVHQAVKEKESPLRFIALLNWFHEAQMATSNEAAKKDDAIPDNNSSQKE
nr:hypothetical protein [Tanacetum cinerariifolium]